MSNMAQQIFYLKNKTNDQFMGFVLAGPGTETVQIITNTMNNVSDIYAKPCNWISQSSVWNARIYWREMLDSGEWEKMEASTR